MMKWLYGAGALFGLVGFISCLVGNEWLAAMYAFSSMLFSASLWIKEAFK